MSTDSWTQQAQRIDKEFVSGVWRVGVLELFRGQAWALVISITFFVLGYIGTLSPLSYYLFRTLVAWGQRSVDLITHALWLSGWLGLTSGLGILGELSGSC